MKMNILKRTARYLVTFCFLILSACGTSPAVHYYALESTGTRVAQDDEGSPIMAVGAIRIPEYLNRSQMVTRGSGAEVIVDDFNHWAEPLDEAIHRVLASNLDVMLDSMVVIAYPSTTTIHSDYRLVGRMDRFTAGPDGMVVLNVQWGVTDAGGVVQVSPRRARFESQAEKPGNPGSIAQSMSAVLEQFSRAIAAEVESIGL